ncbi:MAG TPA: hypothetical protein VEI98_01800 [Xanthobacteraceae bacterium]|nr:hypothetical protein [Xanthobacteraceae bacterium]
MALGAWFTTKPRRSEAAALNAQALALSRQGRYAEAKPLYQRSLMILAAASRALAAGTISGQAAATSKKRIGGERNTWPIK